MTLNYDSHLTFDIPLLKLYHTSLDLPSIVISNHSENLYTRFDVTYVTLWTYNKCDNEYMLSEFESFHTFKTTDGRIAYMYIVNKLNQRNIQLSLTTKYNMPCICISRSVHNIAHAILHAYCFMCCLKKVSRSWSMFEVYLRYRQLFP